MKKPRITILGLCGRSVFLQVDHFHNPGETLHADGMIAEPGGKGYNQAVAAARLGAEVIFFGAIGADDDGKACRDFLLKEGITPYFQIVQDAPTAYACILTDKEGENRVTVCRGASTELSGAFIRQHEDVFASSDILLLNFEVPEEANEAAMELAEKYGAMLLLNPAPAHPCSTAFLDRFYCITPNRSEAEVLGMETEREIITCGGDGVVILENGKKTALPAVRVNAVDTTGAGDCFSAALAVAVGEGKDLADAVQFAQRAAAKSVTKAYVMPSLPYREEIE